MVPVAVPDVAVTSLAADVVSVARASPLASAVTNPGEIRPAVAVNVTGARGTLFPASSRTVATITINVPLLATESILRATVPPSPAPMTISTSSASASPDCALTIAVPVRLPAWKVVVTRPFSVRASRGSTDPSVVANVTTVPFWGAFPPSSRTMAVIWAVPFIGSDVVFTESVTIDPDGASKGTLSQAVETSGRTERARSAMMRDTSGTVKDNRRMKLGGQGELRLPGRYGGQGGYAMATLLVSMGLMTIFMSAALPAWSQMAQREKETEFLFRANQYALAIVRCQQGRKCGANAPAPSIDFLVEQRFLRKKYKDPLTGKDFVPVLINQAVPGAGQQAGAAGQRTGLPGQPNEPDEKSSLATAKSLATDTLRVSASSAGSSSSTPLTGVTSSSKGTALRLFKQQAVTYDQWAVTMNDLAWRFGGHSVGSRFVQVQQQPGQAPGAQPPGQGNPGGQRSGSPFGQPQGGSGGFGGPNQQGTPVLPPQPFGGQGSGQGQPPAAGSPFGSGKPPL